MLIVSRKPLRTLYTAITGPAQLKDGISNQTDAIGARSGAHTAVEPGTEPFRTATERQESPL